MVSNSQIRTLKDKFKKKRLKKPNKWLYPNNAEVKYKKILHKLVREVTKAINEILVPNYETLLQQATRNFPKEDRLDDFLDELRLLILRVQDFINPKINETINEMKLIGDEIAEFNLKQFQKVNNSVFGIDIFTDEPWLKDQLEIFSRQNAQLITSLPEQDLFQVAGIIERGLQEGTPQTTVAKYISKRFGITRRRANLIARDQTAKLNSSLTMLNQQEAGIETYRWQTSGDERVRNSHKIMDGKLCKWQDPTVYFNEGKKKWIPRPKTATQKHPGQDIQCRCNAIARMEDILD